MEDIITILKALSDENRINILRLISQKNICAKGIAHHLNITEAAVSQHIKILKEANLVIGDKRGYHIMYKINKVKLDKVKLFINSINEDKNIVSFSCNNTCRNKRCFNKKNKEGDLKMKIAFPVSSNLGVESIPYGHFGTAPMFVVCDLENQEVKSVNNGDLGHEHGQCQPMKALSGEKVDVVIVGGIGRGAVVGLNNLGIKVFKAIEGTISKNLEAYKNGELQELVMMGTCNHHHDC